MNRTAPSSLLPREQYRMARLQVYNWGTFSGLHDVPVSERGFLIVGRSGAGKSTLLDAFSALLVPPRWIDFNAAAREADRAGRDRNLASYVRGAWSAQSDAASGETATRYLRGGTTWSALALHYRNGNGHDVVLVQLFWIRGNANGNTDVKRYYLVLERPFDLRQLADFASTNFDVRKLKQSLPDAFARDEFRPYCERFCRLLGIDSELALRLLHKTQSAKNLGDLNAFLRDFMLDKPETFAVADRLVNEFAELDAAHQAVVTARQQIQMLAPAREQHLSMEQCQRQRNERHELRAGMNSYRERLRMDLLAAHLAQLEVEADGLQGQQERRRATLENRLLKLRDLEHQRRQAGGEQIEHWENEKSRLESTRQACMRRRKQAVDACERLDWTFPTTPERFAELTGTARQELDAFSRADASYDAMLALDRERGAAEQARAAAAREAASLRRQPSNIPAAMLELRAALARAINVAESALPFAGELIEVKPEEAAWRGAIERVLRGLALSILVDDDHYAALSNYVNATPLGRRLVYLRVGAASAAQAHKALQPASMALKLNVRADSPHGAWLQTELRQRFDYACADSLRAFRAAPDRALTREGQIKHGRARHEKDDRHAIDAREHWALGFDNREKLAFFTEQEQQLAATVRALEERLGAQRKQVEQRAARMLQCQTLVNLQWQEIDVLPILERIKTLERQLADVREGNKALQAIDDQLLQQRTLVRSAEDDFNEAVTDLKTCQRQSAARRAQLETLRADAPAWLLTRFQQDGLDQCYAALPKAPTLDTLDQADRSVAAAINEQVDQLGRRIADCEKFIEARFAAFAHAWPADADGLDASIAAAADFFAKLARLESDGLPAHEHRFFELLQNQSNQNLAALSTYLNDARKAILERMELVNESLRQVPFDRHAGAPTFLQIKASDRQLQEVRDFRQELQRALANVWTEDAAAAEARFVTLRQLVKRLASQEPDLRRWREAVLDVRQHVEFTGIESSQDGVEVQIHQSGAGKSGGQRQKLATTCLAAALRYQLGGADHGVPLYAPVVLDEAFDKADNEFTALAMNIFVNFGFQMIVATPLKSVMTLEPFIGGACFVDIRDRRESGVLMIEYDEQQQQLKLPHHARQEATVEAAQ